MTITSLSRLYKPAPLPQSVSAYRIDWSGTCEACQGFLWVVDLDGGNRRPCPECVSEELEEKMQ